MCWRKPPLEATHPCNFEETMIQEQFTLVTPIDELSSILESMQLVPSRPQQETHLRINLA